MFEPIVIDAGNPGPMTGAGNHTYLLIGSDRTATLVDAGTGLDVHLQGLASALDEATATLTCVAVTHADRDHSSGAPAIAGRHPGARFAKYPSAYDLESVRWEPLTDGEPILFGSGPDERLSVLHTPGHASDHIALWHEPSASVFSGDLVIPASSVMIHATSGGSLIDYLASIRRLLTLEPRRLYPAHGPAVDRPATLLRSYLEHRAEREAQVLDALAAGHATVEAIAECIYDQLSPELAAAARENVRAHLDKLRIEGRAGQRAGRWTRF